MSNEAKMTLEEKIVQRLKDDTLMAAVGDEDMLTDLVKRALNEALFQPLKRSEGGLYGRSYEEPSLVVRTAKEIAQGAINQLAEEMVEKVLENETVRERINEALPGMILDALHGAVGGMAVNVITQASREAEQNVMNAIRDAQQNI